MIGVPVFFHAAALLLPRVDPLGSNYRRFASVYEFYIILFDIFMLAVFAAVIINAMTHFSFCMDTFILILLGIVFANMGNYMPLLRRNFLSAYERRGLCEARKHGIKHTGSRDDAGLPAAC